MMDKGIFRIVVLIFVMGMASGCGSPEDGQSAMSAVKTERMARGQELYLGHGCAVCHGKEGNGDGMAAERFYPPPIDLHDISAYRQGYSAGAVRKTLRTGIRQGNASMPTYDHLTNQELNELTYFLKSLQDAGIQKEGEDNE